MILLKPELFTDLEVGGLDCVQHALQQVIQLEHSTIPGFV
jgi:hypothetical protein